MIVFLHIFDSDALSDLCPHSATFISVNLRSKTDPEPLKGFGNLKRPGAVLIYEYSLLITLVSYRKTPTGHPHN